MREHDGMGVSECGAGLVWIWLCCLSWFCIRFTVQDTDDASFCEAVQRVRVHEGTVTGGTEQTNHTTNQTQWKKTVNQLITVIQDEVSAPGVVVVLLGVDCLLVCCSWTPSILHFMSHMSRTTSTRYIKRAACCLGH